MLHLSASCSYYLYRGHTDMRKGFDSLAGIVSTAMRYNATSGAVFIFFNRKHNQVKLLLFEGDGFSIYHKRLEKGTYEIPCYGEDNSNTSISSQQLQLILQGISLKSVQRRKRYQQQAIYGG